MELRWMSIKGLFGGEAMKIHENAPEEGKRAYRGVLFEILNR